MHSFRDRFWTDNYPEGVPADIDPDKYPNLIALIDDFFTVWKKEQPSYVKNADPILKDNT